ncbi:hypothetical protein GGQ99_002382 [Aminobacter niigataensis]|uniref:Uncharacterized protein n=1 Tax=Aminobacter niigataensis TaxID=83265 RepID=A0ABR6L1E7_9HYPH|nr:hypothetical protein [Aminobacter niigataensis]MBB4650627.1 hypothetical protein [Aminobacter niigataensis]
MYPEWTKYAAKMPATMENRVFELREVRTIMHMQDALKSIEDGRVAARLVYDESKLNKSRLPVVWTSANSWADGSIYGNVEFCFEWARLVSGMEFYWVEAITKYKPPAYRLLVSMPGASLPNGLVAQYNPAVDDGPIKLVAGKWFWNGTNTSEIMFAHDLSLEQATIGFVDHHPRMCRYGGSQCPERTHKNYHASSRVLSHILAKNVQTLDKQLSPQNSGGRNYVLDHATTWLWLKLIQSPPDGGPVNDPKDAANVMLGALALVSMGKMEAAKSTAGTIANKTLRKNALAQIVADHFGIAQWTFENE